MTQATQEHFQEGTLVGFQYEEAGAERKSVKQQACMGGLVEKKVEHMNERVSLDGAGEMAVDNDDALREHNDTKHKNNAKELTLELDGLREMGILLHASVSSSVKSFAGVAIRPEESKQNNHKDNMEDEEEENIVFQPRSKPTHHGSSTGISEERDEARKFKSENIEEAHKKVLQIMMLRNSPLLQAMTDREIANTVATAGLQRLEKGETIVVQGVDAGNLYVLIAGECDAIQRFGKPPFAIEERQCTLSPGNTFAEESILHIPSRMIVRALTPVEIAIIEVRYCEFLVHESPDALKSIQRLINWQEDHKPVYDLLMQRKSLLLKNLKDHELKALAKYVTVKAFSKDSLLCRECETGTSMFIVLRGCARAFNDIEISERAKERRRAKFAARGYSIDDTNLLISANSADKLSVGEQTDFMFSEAARTVFGARETDMHHHRHEVNLYRAGDCFEETAATLQMKRQSSVVVLQGSIIGEISESALNPILINHPTAHLEVKKHWQDVTPLLLVAEAISKRVRELHHDRSRDCDHESAMSPSMEVEQESVCPLSASIAVQEVAPAEFWSESPDKLQLTRPLPQYDLADDADVLASSIIKKDLDLSFIDEDVIKDLTLSPVSKTKHMKFEKALGPQAPEETSEPVLESGDKATTQKGRAAPDAHGAITESEEVSGAMPDAVPVADEEASTSVAKFAPEGHESAGPADTQDDIVKTTVVAGSSEPSADGVAGVGIIFGRNADDTETSALFILLVHPNGPAARTGHLEPMQELISVDGWPVYGQDLATIARHVRGPVGTHVILEVLTLASTGRQTVKVAVAREHTAYSGHTAPVLCQGRPLDHAPRVAAVEADTRAALVVQIPHVLASDTSASCVLPRRLEEKDEEATASELVEAAVLEQASTFTSVGAFRKDDSSDTPAWDKAVPFSLTLDMDFDSIGNQAGFKENVIQDVSTAANIDKKHVKVTALRAGSVIVDMLLAKEAGDPHKIVHGLEEQLRWPDSLLRMGKLTRKTKGLGNRDDAEYYLDDGLQDPLTPAPCGVSQHNQHAAGLVGAWPRVRQRQKHNDLFGGCDHESAIESEMSPRFENVIKYALPRSSTGSESDSSAESKMNGETLSRVRQVFRQRPLSPRVIYVIYDAQQHTAAASQVIHTQMISGADEGKSKLPNTEGALKQDTTVADLEGIGIAFGRNDGEDETSALFILLVHPNGPAARTGHLEPMQEIISVDGWPVYGQDLATIARHVRGPVGTHVILEVLTLASTGRQTLKVAVAREHTACSGPTAPVLCQGRPSDLSSRVAEAEADTRAALVVQIPQLLTANTTASCVLPGLLDERNLEEVMALEEESSVLEEAAELLQQASSCTSATVGTFRTDLPEATQASLEAVNHSSRALSVEMTPLYRGQRLIIESLSSCSPKASSDIVPLPEEATVLEQACTLTQVGNMADMAGTAGIGIRFGRNEDGSETSAVFILRVHPNGPAARAGHFEPMQELISVDGWLVCGHDLATIAQHVRGPVGTQVILEVLTLASKGRQTLKVAVVREHTACSGPTAPVPCRGSPLDPYSRVAEAEADTRAALVAKIPQVLASDTTASCVLPRLLEERDLEEATASEEDATVFCVLPPIPEETPSRACSDASQACTLTQVANVPSLAGIAGIGIRFGYNEDDSESSAVFILLVHPNGPAARAGHFEPMQELISVDGWPVYGQDLATIAQHVRGPVGTHVILEVLTLASKGRQTLKVAVAREHTPGFTPHVLPTSVLVSPSQLYDRC